MSYNCACKSTKSACSCREKEHDERRPKCTCKEESLDECISDYLKPITYDDLFDEKSNKCSDYNLIIKKLTEVRMSFFAFHAAICNFIGDCTKLKQKARDDISGSDLLSLKYDYQVLLNTLITTVAMNMRKKIKDDNFVLINFEVPPTRPGKTIENSQNIWPTDIIYTDSGGIDTLVVSIPTVTLYLCCNLQLQVKITTPKGISYSNITYENTYVKSHRQKENESFIRNLTPELLLHNGEYEFRDAENANEILDDIINYSTDENILSHNLKDVIERINSICTCIENAHRTIIQKIKTEKMGQAGPVKK